MVKTALTDASPFLFVGVRFSLATLAALPLLFYRRKSARETLRTFLLAGLPLGLILAGSYSTQTIGLETTTPSRSAFITALNVALVPIWALALFRKRPGWMPVLGLLLAMVGLWILTSPDAGSWRSGDTWTAVCAILYGLYVVLLDRLGPTHATGALLVSQLAGTAAFAFVGSAVFEEARMEWTPRLAGALALTAFLATTGTCWLQIKLQPKVGPTRSAVIYATESLFAALFSRIVTGEVLTPSAWAGGGIILAGMLLSEVGSGKAVAERS